MKRPSATELAKAKNLLKELTPTAAISREYREIMQIYHAAHKDGRLPHIPSLRKNGRIINTVDYRSLLFRRIYLIVCVEDSWFRDEFPETDAVASPPRDTGVVTIPSRIIVPVSRFESGDMQFRTIVEHEIVHVNQGLLGMYPQLQDTSQAHDLITYFFDMMRTEFQAYFLQATRWPQFHIQGPFDLSIENHCAFRGYVQAFQNVMTHMAAEKTPVSIVRDFLTQLPTRLETALEQNAMNPALADWLRKSFTHDTRVTLKLVKEWNPTYRTSAALKAISTWLRDTR